MKNIIFLILIAFSFQTKAQVVEASTTIPTNDYLDLLAANLVIPDSVQQKFPNQDLSLTIVLTITKNGSVFNPKIQNDSLQLESSLEKAIETLPKWNPKTEDGVAVVSRKAFNLIIPIKRQETENLNLVKAVPVEGIRNFMKTFVQKFDIGKNYKDIPYNQLKLIVKFIIEKDGSLTNFEIVSANTPLFQSEIIQVLKSMPKWQPATENGIPIRSSFSLPISINIK